MCRSFCWLCSSFVNSTYQSL